jgi:hypothetical protein
MDDLNELERHVLEMLLAGEGPVLDGLRKQRRTRHLRSASSPASASTCRFTSRLTLQSSRMVAASRSVM